MKITSRYFLAGLLIVCATLPVFSQKQFTQKQRAAQCDRIREACRHAWKGYLHYANGFDGLKPISKQGHNWYGPSFLMTPVDAYDTFVLLGMKEAADQAKALILGGLSFDTDTEVQVFEVNIRLVGGLISAYELSGEKRFLELATDLGNRLLPAFRSSTGMPWRYVNLKTGKVRDSISNPAEIGTCLLEFGKLTRLTHDSTYYRAAKKAVVEVYRRRSDIDLPGTTINVETGAWVNTESQIGARIDSYYEYLYKAWLLFGDKECRQMWEHHNKAILKYLLTGTSGENYFTRVDMTSGKETHSLYGALDAFYAGILALSGDIKTARGIQTGNYRMWTKWNMEPEEFDFRTWKITDPSYPLRPENLESCFYLYRATHDQQYLFMGKRMISDILSRCKTEAGYAAVKDVAKMELADSMESFFFAETLKYAYLLFAPDSALDLKRVVFNTEAHPLKMTSD